MISSIPGLMDTVRSRLVDIDTCPFEGPRIYFENAGGALDLKAVVETTAAYAGYPDNQGRDNQGPQANGRDRKRSPRHADVPECGGGEIFMGESGTQVLFRLVRTAALASTGKGVMLGSTLEHPATRSAMARWADVTGRAHVLAKHDDTTGTVDLAAYEGVLTPEVRVGASISRVVTRTRVRVARMLPSTT